jgi:hypothetical protein
VSSIYKQRHIAEDAIVHVSGSLFVLTHKLQHIAAVIKLSPQETRS